MSESKNYTKINNDLLETLMKLRLGGLQKDVIICIIRQTSGWHRNEAELSVRFIAGMIDSKPARVSEALSKLIDKNIVNVKREPTFTQSRILSINMNFDMWNKKTEQFDVEQQFAIEKRHQFGTEKLQQFAKEKQIKERIKENIKKDMSEDPLTESSKVSQLKTDFEKFRKSYPGTKRGFDTEWNDFIKKHKDWRKVVPLLLVSLNKQTDSRQQKKSKGNFAPEWKNLKTWLFQSCWTEEPGVGESSINITQPTRSKTIIKKYSKEEIGKIESGSMLKILNETSNSLQMED